MASGSVGSLPLVCTMGFNSSRRHCLKRNRVYRLLTVVTMSFSDCEIKVDKLLICIEYNLLSVFRTLSRYVVIHFVIQFNSFYIYGSIFLFPKLLVSVVSSCSKIVSVFEVVIAVQILVEDLPDS